MRFSFAFLALLGAVGAADLPVLTLPWGKYQGEVSPVDEEVIIFKNVRFGAEPKRFGAPSFPDWKDDSIQDSNRNTTCIQIDPRNLEHPPAAGSPLEDPHKLPEAQTEDCLFLDIYVPSWVFTEEESAPLPVVVWIYGGGYAFGAKNQGGPLYTGYPLLRESQYNAIFVTGNHRVGAFGWLAGDYMQKVGQPNAGLYDQALLFEWVQEYIHQVKGDKEAVSAWGESAGGGSILHHLIRNEGTKDPLFQSFAAQSPGFEWAWDNSAGGKLDTMYRNFSRLAGCEFAYDIECLRKADVADLAKANQDLYDQVRQTGLFPVGPAVDGSWVKSLSTVLFSEGKYWKNIYGSIITHVANEGWLFAPKDMDSEAKYDAFLQEFLPGSALAPQRSAIKEQYNCKRDYLTYKLCVAAIIAHGVFTCNTRDLATAYPDNTHMLEYSFPGDGIAYHGSDLVPEFMTSVEEAKAMFIALDVAEGTAEVFATTLNSLIRYPYQRYFASFGAFGNPNSGGNNMFWPTVVNEGDEFGDVLQVKLGWTSAASFTITSDKKNKKSTCAFWQGIAKDISESRHAYGDEQAGYLETQVPLGVNYEL